MRRTSVAAAVLAAATAALVAGVPGHVGATETEPEPPVTPFLDSGNTLPNLEARAARPLGRWYGWQIAAADAGTVLCAVATRSKICAVPFVLSGPIVHLAHDRPGLALASLGLRGVLPVMGALMAGSDPCHHAPPPSPMPDQGDSPYFAIPSGDFLCFATPSPKGALIGAGIAAAIDAAIGFARATPPDGARTIEPQVSVGARGFGLGLGAAF